MLYIIILWSLVAVILHYCEVGKFKDWPVNDWPWKWSCLCLLQWNIIIAIILFGLIMLLAFLAGV